MNCNRLTTFLLAALLLPLAACSGGAVRFAPTPVPPDVSPSVYTHPSGAFSVELPRAWSLFERNAITLAAATFSAPGQHTPPLRIAAVRLQAPPADATAINGILDDYQGRVRPDAGRYTEQSREAMGDGSWRLSGLRQVAGGTTQQVNTFVQFEEATVGVVEVIVSGDAAQDERLQALVNTVEFAAESNLQPGDLSTLAFANASGLEPLNVHAWTAPNGAFYISGEVANYGTEAIGDVPVQVVLYTSDGRAIAEALDTVMGYGIPPGGFAPFSLRFGAGQPALTTRYVLSFGDDNWAPTPAEVLSEEVLTWTDEGEFTDGGELIITGALTNTSADTYVYEPRVTVTVFDDGQRVIAAGFQDVDETEVEPDESVPFRVVIPETGGVPARYILNVQGRP